MAEKHPGNSQAPFIEGLDPISNRWQYVCSSLSTHGHTSTHIKLSQGCHVPFSVTCLAVHPRSASSLASSSATPAGERPTKSSQQSSPEAQQGFGLSKSVQKKMEEERIRNKIWKHHIPSLPLESGLEINRWYS